ncbi:MAG: glycosyltransferase family 4 protein [Lentimicrobiaceae bacterium]|nr:glycosyltransferase family 4 protein [Lentimicrobiaceae bacterium]
MRLIINTVNIRVGGMLQVALSFIDELREIPGNEYHVFLSPEVERQVRKDKFPPNFRFYSFIQYSGYSARLMRKWMSFKKLRRMKLLEKMIKPEVVFSVFGPTYWKPGVPHVAGFATPQYIYPESPYFRQVPFSQRIKYTLFDRLRLLLMMRNIDFLIAETVEVKQRLTTYLRVDAKRVFHVSNTLNSIYFQPEKWDYRAKLPPREPNELRLVTISANHLFKNLKIINEVINQIRILRPKLNVRFVLTIHRREFKNLGTNRKYVYFTNRLNVNECPYLYSQCDFMFLPSLLECFSASYPEAMKMGLPILTSDLNFAREICGDSALYFNPVDARDIAAKIIFLYDNPELQRKMTAEGFKKLPQFGNSHERAVKYLDVAQMASKSSAMQTRGLHNSVILPALPDGAAF